MDSLTKAATAFLEAAATVSEKATKAIPEPPEISKISFAGWFAIVMLTIIANTLITIYLYPSKKPDYWWLPGAWIWFKIRDYIWPIDPNANDPNKRLRRYSPPRIA